MDMGEKQMPGGTCNKEGQMADKMKNSWKIEVLVRILVLLKTSHGKPFQVLLDLLKMLAVFCSIYFGL